MRIGVQLPEVERPVTWVEVRDIARTAEDHGFDSIWVGDHLLYRDDVNGVRGPMEAWSVLAALAAVTTRVRLGPLVASTAFHNPAMIAKKAATVDEISGGRFVLGLGAGWNEAEFRGFGFPHDHRVSRFAEAFTIIRTLLREGSIDFHGRYHVLRECELVPRPRPDIPLMVGSNGPRMLRITAPWIDSWNTWHVWFGNRPEGLGPLQAAVDEACAAAGRDPATVERTAAVYVQLPGASGRSAGSPTRPTATPVTGTPEEIVAQLAGFEAAGIDHVQLVVDPIDARSVEALGRALASR